MVDFPKFKSCMEKIQACSDWIDELEKYGINLLESPVEHLLNEFYEFLSHEMHDDNEWVGWYCWETEFGRNTDLNWIEIDNKKVVINNFEALYKLITEEGK